MWCLMAAPLLVATDIRNLTDIMKEVCSRICYGQETLICSITTVYRYN